MDDLDPFVADHTRERIGCAFTETTTKNHERRDTVRSMVLLLLNEMATVSNESSKVATSGGPLDAAASGP